MLSHLKILVEKCRNILRGDCMWKCCSFACFGTVKINILDMCIKRTRLPGWVGQWSVCGVTVNRPTMKHRTNLVSPHSPPPPPPPPPPAPPPFHYPCNPPPSQFPNRVNCNSLPERKGRRGCHYEAKWPRHRVDQS